MTLPEYIEAFDAPTGSDEPHGILYQIRGNVTNNKITKFVVPTDRGLSNRELYSPIKWTYAWQGQDLAGYYQIEFKDRFVFPTYYSLKGLHGYSFGKEWDLYGFNSGEKPKLLSSDTRIGSTYCGNGTNCVSNDWGTLFFRLTHPKY